MCVFLPLLALALGDTQVRIDATVADDLRTVSGTLTVEGEAYTLVDPLAALPIPDTDEAIQATFPGAISRGRIEQTAVAPETWSFTAVLPRRYGDIGSTVRHGLFANGGWYPQPMVDGHLPETTWDVTVRLPLGTAGALGDVTGTEVLRWEGRGERASLAVVPRGVVTEIDSEDAHLSLLTRGRPRPVLVRFLEEQLPGVIPTTGPGDGVIVEAPLRRRLVNPGVRMSYLSDRAWRLTPGFRRFHDVAVMRGVANALLDQPDPFARDLAAASITARYAENVEGAAAEDALKWVAWIPLVDKMLHGRHTPFITEILEEPLPGDPVRDDLVEVLDPHWPGGAVSAQVDDRYGDGTGARLGAALESGMPLEQAAASTGLDPLWLASLRGPLPDQDYVLDVHDGVATVRRDAPPDAPAEVILVATDDQPVPWLAGPGPDAETFPVERKVALDPDRHVAQRSTAGDTWPTRFTPVFSAWFTRVDLRTLYFDGFLQLALRRQYDTRQVGKLKVYADEQTLVGAELGYVRMFGPEVDGLRREHQVALTFSPGILSKRYAPTGEDVAVLGGVLSYTWDDTVARYFPLRGHRVVVSVDAGTAPASGDGWRAARSEGLVYLSPHPRIALPAELLVGVAGGTVTHRLVDLGGLDGMRSLPTGVAVGNARLMSRVETRWAMLHNAAVPALLLWLNELSISGGVEAGGALIDGKLVGAVGATAGLGWQVSLLGANPSYARLRMGYPLWTHGLVVPATPQIVLEGETVF